MELYVAAAKELPIAFHGPLVWRVLVGGADKPSFESGPVEFDKFCAWDYRRPDHTTEVPGSASLVIQLVTATKGSKAASLFFFFFFFFFFSPFR